jgi:MSHA biogenesis protein MshN
VSLINQVLQDLEKRHASEPELKSLPPHVRAVAGAGWRPSSSLIAIGVIILGVAAIAAAVYFGGWLKPAPPVIVQAAPGAAAPPAAPVPPEPRPAPAPAPAEHAETFVPASRLSEELSFVPEARPRREAAPRPEKPAAARVAEAKPAAGIPPEFRAAIDPPPQKPAAPAASPASAAPPAVPAPRPAETAASPAPAPVPHAGEPRGSIDKQVREMTSQQRAEIVFRRGVAQLQEARAAAAETDFREALKEDPTHVGARQALLGLLLDARRNDDAEQLLKQTLEINPRQPRHAMVLARLQVDRGEVTGAINTLVAALPYVQSDAEYYAFLAALLQREGRHRETVDYYRSALRISPGNGLWLMGLGISLRATSQFGDAREVFQRALDTKQLSGDLKTFTERQLRELGPAAKK